MVSGTDRQTDRQSGRRRRARSSPAEGGGRIDICNNGFRAAAGCVEQEEARIVRKKTTAAIVRSSGGGKVSSGWFGASTARCLQNKQQPSGYVDAPGPSNAHAAFGARGDGVANPPGCGRKRRANVSRHT